MGKKEMTFTKSFKRFFKPIFDERKMSLMAIFPSILGSLVGISTVYLLKEITNKIPSGWDDEIIFLLIIFVGLVVLYYIIYLLTRFWTNVTIWPMFRKYFYKKFIKKYTYLDNNEIEKIGTGKLIALIDKGIFAWVDLISRFFVDILPNVLFTIFSFIFIGFINIYYFIIIFSIFTFIFILTYFLQANAKIYRIKRRDINIGINKQFVKILMSKYEILQNNKSDFEIKYISDALDKNKVFNSKVQNFNITTDLLMKILIDGSKVGIIIMFGIGFLGNTINFGEFVSLMSVIYILDQIFMKSIADYINFTKIIVEVEKLWEFFDNTKIIKGYEKGKIFEYKKGDIKISDLNYGYSKKTMVFKDFSLKIKGGDITALVGNSGSGKSTLVKLIAGYINTKKGNISIDKQDINKIALKTYYKNIGYLTQDPSVFDGTILENLTYSIDRELKEGELENILKLAKCEFIYELQDGINTEIGERGVRLSGGQKQRLAIAKIFLKDPKIIILDEPTSALDSFSEEKITKAMHNLFKKRTVIIIAHRLQTVKHANDIILLENGEIKERGTHNELVKLKGQYKKMLDLQSGF